ncbi:hypothetical protein KI387_017997, partial [Taxus chinensis]
VRGHQLLKGRCDLLLENFSVSAMHMTLLHTNKVLIFNQTLVGPSQITRTDPSCNKTSSPATEDCWVHSIEYDIASNMVRPLHIIIDTFCSSGSFASNGTLVQTSGWINGDRVTRYFTLCSDSSYDWIDSPTLLSSRRRYALNRSYQMIESSLWEAADRLAMSLYQNNLERGHFSSHFWDSILLDYNKNQVVRTFPTMPSSGARNYPSFGYSIMLPLESANNFQRVEILICGGAPNGAFKKATFNQMSVEALKSCRRMEITSQNPQWKMEDMPRPRVVNDKLILRTGEVLIINSAKQGTASWQSTREPVLSPFLYRRAVEALSNWFRVLVPTKIPQMYHSTANVLPDRWVLVGGRNSNFGYRFSGVAFPIELRMEAYIPYYLHLFYYWSSIDEFSHLDIFILS